jgi:hypothetical protein
MLGDPFQDDPVPPKPTPTSLPAEVRRAPANQLKPPATLPREAVSVKAISPANQSAATNNSPYKIVNGQPSAPLPKTTTRKPASTITTTEEVRTVPARPVLRQTSAETEVTEPARHNINQSRARPIVRSQSPEYNDNGVPLNPLR